MRTVFPLLALLFGASHTPAIADSGWVPKPDQITKLEKKLVLPAGASPLSKYGRYYWGVTTQGRKFIYGSLQSLGSRKPGLVVTNHPPEDGVSDGGCGVIFVIYDPSRDAVGVRCNGLA